LGSPDPPCFSPGGRSRQTNVVSEGSANDW